MKKNIVRACSAETGQGISNFYIDRKPPGVLFVVLLLVYILAAVFVNITAQLESNLVFFGQAVQLSFLTGAISSVANLCAIFLVIFYSKHGFIASIIILLAQFPNLIIEFIFKHNYFGITGFFVNILTVLAVCIIYINKKKVERYQITIQEYAVTDRLTKLPNRIACSMHMDELIKCNKPFVVAIMNLNNFKSINNALGQSIGDAILSEIAIRLKETTIRDTSGTSVFLAYNGGDEFTLVINNYRDSDELVKVLEYYKATLNDTITFKECEYFISARIGYAEYPRDAKSSEDLYICALTAVTNAKKDRGKSHICGFMSNMYSAEREIDMERKIREALKEGRVYFYLQPQYNIMHRLRGFEVLARICDKDGNIISPVEFIPIAEKAGLIDSIDYTVFRNASKFLGELIRHTGTDIILSVNVSVMHLMKKNFLSEVQEILEKSDVPANRIEIEITESIMIDSIDEAVRSISELKKMGFRIAIDDFGTGYSSLSYLNTFPADILKVDKSFIKKISSGSSHEKYVAAIISIGHIMNFGVVAEGVETSEQLEILRNVGCDYIQGFYWGEPMPREEAEKLVIENERKP
ncbi:MAG: EAL domain-containing protein [Firmicutes bacterium]|nr:EAL domain-containing protein [Bacillota bacterium]